ncbi:MAG: class D beta-lactamase [Kordiimonadaceae bacterium]|jgi:beta-lactamase class D|nr:class D beta-lactamase [Kordiimonadaceae bacterium]
MKFIIALLTLSFANIAYSEEFNEIPEIAKLFQDVNVEGTFVLYDLSKNKLSGYNGLRAKREFIPASTFKIANSLIGLESGTISSVDEVLPYGGEPQFIKAWENDMGLRDAIKISNVPIYQELARRIGLDRMQDMISKLGYGNQDIGSVVDRFWLDGPLKISALEQVKFIAKLIKDELPILQKHQAEVREILLLEQMEKYSLYAKSGWTTAPDPDIGWWVGWVNRDGKNYAFALNINTYNMDDVAKRETLTRAALKILNLL